MITSEKPAELAELLALVNTGRRIVDLECSLSAAHAKNPAALNHGVQA
jgi:hypothetical protein